MSNESLCSLAPADSAWSFLLFTQDAHYKIASLGGAVEELMIFAQETGDRPLYDILDDFDYAVKECGMGAPSKGKSELDKGAYKLDEYDYKGRSKPLP